jgi:hypothetical protein
VQEGAVDLIAYMNNKKALKNFGEFAPIIKEIEEEDD